MPLAPIVIIGKSLKENFDNEGVLASSGKSLIIALIFRCASFSETFTSASVVNSIVTVDKLSND